VNQYLPDFVPSFVLGERVRLFGRRRVMVGLGRLELPCASCDHTDSTVRLHHASPPPLGARYAFNQPLSTNRLHRLNSFHLPPLRVKRAIKKAAASKFRRSRKATRTASYRKGTACELQPRTRSSRAPRPRACRATTGAVAPKRGGRVVQPHRPARRRERPRSSSRYRPMDGTNGTAADLRLRMLG